MSFSTGPQPFVADAHAISLANFIKMGAHPLYVAVYVTLVLPAVTLCWAAPLSDQRENTQVPWGVGAVIVWTEPVTVG